jgi:hypothetical protein
MGTSIEWPHFSSPHGLHGSSGSIHSREAPTSPHRRNYAIHPACIDNHTSNFPNITHQVPPIFKPLNQHSSATPVPGRLFPRGTLLDRETGGREAPDADPWHFSCLLLVLIHQHHISSVGGYRLDVRTRLDSTTPIPLSLSPFCEASELPIDRLSIRLLTRTQPSSSSSEHHTRAINTHLEY